MHKNIKTVQCMCCKCFPISNKPGPVVTSRSSYDKGDTVSDMCTPVPCFSCFPAKYIYWSIAHLLLPRVLHGVAPPGNDEELNYLRMISGLFQKESRTSDGFLESECKKIPNKKENYKNRRMNFELDLERAGCL